MTSMIWRTPWQGLLGTMLPLVVERTMAANFEHSDGYVLNTLMLSKYSGTDPAVDQEFQIAGRPA